MLTWVLTLIAVVRYNVATKEILLGNISGYGMTFSLVFYARLSSSQAAELQDDTQLED